MSRYKDISAEFKSRAQHLGFPVPEGFRLDVPLPDDDEIMRNAGLVGTWVGKRRASPDWAVIPTWTVENGVTIRVEHTASRPLLVHDAPRLVQHIQEVIDEAVGAQATALRDVE